MQADGGGRWWSTGGLSPPPLSSAPCNHSSSPSFWLSALSSLGFPLSSMFTSSNLIHPPIPWDVSVCSPLSHRFRERQNKPGDEREKEKKKRAGRVLTLLHFPLVLTPSSTFLPPSFPFSRPRSPLPLPSSPSLYFGSQYPLPHPPTFSSSLSSCFHLPVLLLHSSFSLLSGTTLGHNLLSFYPSSLPRPPLIPSYPLLRLSVC